jgi:hypothetical protein
MLSGTGKILKSEFLLSTPREPTGKVNVSLMHFSTSALDEADRLTSSSGRFTLKERKPISIE